MQSLRKATVPKEPSAFGTVLWGVNPRVSGACPQDAVQIPSRPLVFNNQDEYKLM